MPNANREPEDFESTMQRRVSTLEADVHGIIGQLKDVRQAIAELANKMSRGTDWGVIATFLGVVLTIVGMGTAATWTVGWILLSNVRESIADVDQRAREHAAELGHPQTVVEQIKSLKLRLQDTRDELAREREDDRRAHDQLRYERDLLWRRGPGESEP